MEEEFNLSEKFYLRIIDGKNKKCYKEENVKEFIRLLKEEIKKDQDICLSYMDEERMDKIIDKLAGEKLI
jgi:hypothetical protein